VPYTNEEYKNVGTDLPAVLEVNNYMGSCDRNNRECSKMKSISWMQLLFREYRVSYAEESHICRRRP
jgi:hypothetical protein